MLDAPLDTIITGTPPDPFPEFPNGGDDNTVVVLVAIEGHLNQGDWIKMGSDAGLGTVSGALIATGHWVGDVIRVRIRAMNVFDLGDDTKNWEATYSVTLQVRTLSLACTLTTLTAERGKRPWIPSGTLHTALPLQRTLPSSWSTTRARNPSTLPLRASTCPCPCAVTCHLRARDRQALRRPLSSVRWLCELPSRLVALFMPPPAKISPDCPRWSNTTCTRSDPVRFSDCVLSDLFSLTQVRARNPTMRSAYERGLETKKEYLRSHPHRRAPLHRRAPHHARAREHGHIAPAKNHKPAAHAHKPVRSGHHLKGRRHQ